MQSFVSIVWVRVKGHTHYVQFMNWTRQNKENQS